MPLRPDLHSWAGQVIDYATHQGAGLERRCAALAGVDADVVCSARDVELFNQALFDGKESAEHRPVIFALDELPEELWRSSPITYGDLDGRGAVAGSDDGRFAISWNSGQFILTIMDRVGDVIAYIKQGGFPPSERGGPLRTPGHWLASEHSLTFVHAAALTLGNRAVVIGGSSGSGKSTLTLKALVGGARVVGDDYVVLETESAIPRVRAAYRTVKVHHEAGIGFFGVGFDLSNGKSAHVLNVNQMVEDAPVSACAVVDPDGPETPEPADPAWVARALAASTILQVPLYADHVLASVTRTTSRVPCFRIGWVSTPDQAIDSLRRMGAT